MSESVFVKRHGKPTLSALRLRLALWQARGATCWLGADFWRAACPVLATGWGGGEGCVAGFPGARPRQLERLRLLLAVLTDLPTGVQDIDVAKDSAGRYYWSRLRPNSPARWRSVFTCVFTSPSRRVSRLGPAGFASSVRQSVHSQRAGPARAPGEASRSLARRRRRWCSRGTGRDLDDAAHQQVPDVIREAAQVSLRPGRRDLSVGLEASILARRHAMTAAGSVFLHRRLLLDRLARPTERAVERTGALRRTCELRPACPHAAIGNRCRWPLLVPWSDRRGRWIERPRKPFTPESSLKVRHSACTSRSEASCGGA